MVVYDEREKSKDYPLPKIYQSKVNSKNLRIYPPYIQVYQIERRS
jgi:hypothetical protein